MSLASVRRRKGLSGLGAVVGWSCWYDNGTRTMPYNDPSAIGGCQPIIDNTPVNVSYNNTTNAPVQTTVQAPTQTQASAQDTGIGNKSLTPQAPINQSGIVDFGNIQPAPSVIPPQPAAQVVASLPPLNPIVNFSASTFPEIPAWLAEYWYIPAIGIVAIYILLNKKK